MRTQAPASDSALQHPLRSSHFLPGPRLPIPPSSRTALGGACLGWPLIAPGSRPRPGFAARDALTPLARSGSWSRQGHRLAGSNYGHAPGGGLGGGGLQQA